LWLTSSGYAQQAADQAPPLPDPLTLEKALELADEPHPDLQISEAGIRAAEAELEEARSGDDMDIYLEGALRYVQPPAYNPDQTHDDNQLTINLDKTLYDFGRTDSASNAAAKDLASSQLLNINARQLHRLAIMQRYFDVVLADLQFYRYNEEMAVEYVALDRLRDRHELGQVSDLALLEQEAAYQRIRHLRARSQNQQRLARSKLAQALNRPGQLPSTVVPPDLSILSQPLPEVEQLQALAFRNNPVLKSLRERVAARRARVEAARAGDNPVVKGKLEAGTYSKERNSYDDWRAELSVKVPLYDGSRTDAAVAREKARLFELQSQLTRAERSVKEQVLELWLQLDDLKTQRDQRETETQYRELYLDRSRALYELEVKADLGDAMVRYTEAERNARETDYQVALTWARLNALLGQLHIEKAFVPPTTPQKDKTNEQLQ
jgi:outer membrane protein TolC